MSVLLLCKTVLIDDYLDDYEWALDCGQRRFRVRPFRLNDEVDSYACQLGAYLTIIDLKSIGRFGRVSCLATTSFHINDSHTPGHWKNTDQWALRRWRLSEHRFGGGPIRPTWR